MEHLIINGQPYPCTIEQSADGSYWVEVEGLEGTYCEGETKEEVKTALVEVAESVLAQVS